ncbi:beta-1 adrenergic receptor-like [Bacillus rossius redtenbacheri]|uniref:beta-1 adrenergic receptor-like n=1 Tax=Bacillus rossius redtenbacheri TaxID=93214 RepID=UPI002FDD8D17
MLGTSYKLMTPSLEREDVAGGSAHALQAAALILLAVFGSGTNILVAVVFYRRPTLRSPSNRFVLSLVLANLLTSLVVAPLLVAETAHHDAAAAPWLRQLARGGTAFAVTASVLSVLAIAVDRYNAVLAPLHYAMTATRQRSRGMIAGVWGVAALLAAPHALGADFHRLQPAAADFRPLQPAPAGREVFTLTYALVLVTVGFTLPLFALCWIYARMYSAAHRNSERTRRHSVCTNPGSLDLALPPPGTAPDHHQLRRTWRGPPLGQIAAPKRRSSNASFSALLFREEGRAVKTAAMVIASYLFCWTPYFAMLLVDTWGDAGGPAEGDVVPESFRFLSLLSALSSGCVTPFIYVFRNETARQEAVKVLTWWRRARGKYAGEPAAGAGAEAAPARCGSGKPPRQSLSYCDSTSVQSFRVSAAQPECRHCGGDAVARSAPASSADFVASYDVVECPGEEEARRGKPQVEGSPTARAKPRRESVGVTFRLAFLPQRRCQTCVRQNSDSSSGSGHPLIREGDATDSPALRAARCNNNNNNNNNSGGGGAALRRQKLLAGQQGSSGEELTVSESEPGTPRRFHVGDSGDGDAVILELDEPFGEAVARPQSVFQFQETALESLAPLSASQEQEPFPRQDSARSESAAVRQDSDYSDVTVDSGVVADMLPPGLGRSQSACSLGQRPERRRHKLQRLAAVEDEEIVSVPREDDEEEEAGGGDRRPSVTSRIRSGLRSSFHRPSFLLARCDT